LQRQIDDLSSLVLINVAPFLFIVESLYNIAIIRKHLQLRGEPDLAVVRLASQCCIISNQNDVCWWAVLRADNEGQW